MRTLLLAAAALLFLGWPLTTGARADEATKITDVRCPGTWRASAEPTAMTLVLRADQTCTFRYATTPKATPQTTTGVWVRRGDQVYVVHTHADGKRLRAGPRVDDWTVESGTTLRKTGSMIYLSRR